MGYWLVAHQLSSIATAKVVRTRTKAETLTHQSFTFCPLPSAISTFGTGEALGEPFFGNSDQRLLIWFSPVYLDRCVTIKMLNPQ
jgi:hypothetical protein